MSKPYLLFIQESLQGDSVANEASNKDIKQDSMSNEAVCTLKTLNKYV